MSEREVLAIVGNGMAGQRLCERLVQLGANGRQRIVVFSAEARPAYDRVHLGEVLRGRSPETLVYHDEPWYRSHGVDLRLKDPVDRLDLRARRVHSLSGACLEYDRLVLATGSSAVTPAIDGLPLPSVFSYRSLDDATAIRAAALNCAARAGLAAVLGGGLLGIEAARLLQGLGCRVVLLERAPHVLPRQLPAVTSALLAAQLRERGVELRLACGVRRIAETDRRLRLELSDGNALEVELLILAAGVRPNDALARSAGLRCDPQGGIAVDDSLCTSEPDVYAVGECARHGGVVPGLAAIALEMADVLAARLAGQRRRFAGCVPATRLKVEDVEVIVAGDTLADGAGCQLLTFERENRHRNLVLERGRVIGAAAIGPWSDWGRVHAAVGERARLSPRARERFARTGSPWRSPTRPIATWPDGAVLCNCTGLTCGAARRALADGLRGAAALAAHTGASTFCGTCRPRLEELAGEDVAPRRRRIAAGLAACAALAGLMSLALLLVPAFPVPSSVQSGRLAALLWQDGTVRQFTGFSALALCLASFGLSLRKRWRGFRLGSFRAWRIAHSALGASLLGAVAVHTGFRTGGHLDQLLLASLIALACAGAAAAAVSSAETHLPDRTGVSLRNLAAQAHVWLFWPFPVLVFFHVLKVYWF